MSVYSTLGSRSMKYLLGATFLATGLTLIVWSTTSHYGDTHPLTQSPKVHCGCIPENGECTLPCYGCCRDSKPEGCPKPSCCGKDH